VSKRTDPKDVFDQIIEEMNAEKPPSESILTNGHRPGTPALADLEDRAPNAPTDDDVEPSEAARATEDDVENSTDATEPPSGETDDAPTTPRRSRRIVRRTLQAAAGLILIAVLASAGFLGWQFKQRADVAAAGQGALDAARTYAVTLSTVDSNAIDKNIGQVLDGATGEFKSMYSQASSQLRQLLVDNKAVSNGTVVDAGIKSATKDKVEVMLFLDQSVTNAINPAPRIDRLRVVMTMDLVDHRWLASKFDIE
jgi:Mce-associated membrane protein